jgi:X-Pro dipeptidyl-peptidase
MSAKRIVPVLIAVILFAGVMKAPGGAAAQSYSTLLETHIVETRHGNIYMEVARPMDGDKSVPGPVVLTYSPYSVLGRSDNRDLVANGYVVAFADVVGTGNSGGCYDYGAKREKETGFDIVEWLGTQKWSTGKVAMTGGSYNGTTAIAAATQRPPHLTTIVPEAAISRWYEYAYSGGIRYSANNESPSDEGFDTPLAFDFGLAMPPPLDPQDPDYADRVTSTVTPCEEIEHTERGYDDTPVYDDFWLERDYIKDADKIDIPVLIAHNWGDWNVKQEEAINLFRALKNSPKKALYLGTRYSGHGTPGGEYDATKLAWFDHYLMGKDNGIDKLAAVTSEMSTFDGADKWYSGPYPKTTPVTLYAQNSTKVGDTAYEWKLSPSKPKGSDAVAQFVSTNQNAELYANENRRNNESWFWFETQPLKQDARIFGSPTVHVFSTTQRDWLTLTPTVVDVTPEGAAFSATRGWLDSRYLENGRKEAPPITLGESLGMKIVEKPQDYTFKKGHLIGLNISTEITEWNLAKPYPCSAPGCETVQIDWTKGQTKLVLPVVGSPEKAGAAFGLSSGQTTLPGPRVKMRASDLTPKRGEIVRLRTRLRVCGNHGASKIELHRKAGGIFKKVAARKLGRGCVATFKVKATFRKATFRAIWPKQDDDHRSGRSKTATITTH